ncbi:MAG: lipopolysaccharide assembly protein LapA domain-containing protein [Candidatus Latescibacterota bacterium]
MMKGKLIVVSVLAAVGIVIVLQNTEVVETKVLFATVVMPRAFLLLTTTVLGFVLGMLVSILWAKRRASHK